MCSNNIILQRLLGYDFKNKKEIINPEFFNELINGVPSRVTTIDVQKMIYEKYQEDDIPVELLQAAGTNYNKAFRQLLLQIWNER